jgi:hypothetical protein
MVLGLVPLLLSLALTLKVGTMLQLNHAGRHDLAAGHYADAADSFDATRFANAFEPWVATYDAGTALYLKGEFAEARDRLRRSLADVPAQQECRVRINLALTDEAMGDAAVADGDVAAARTAWEEGRAVLAANDCTSPTGDQGRTAATIDTRLAGKVAATPGDTEESTVPPPDPTTAQSLERRNERAAQVRQREEERRERRRVQRDHHHPDQAPDIEEPVYQW